MRKLLVLVVLALIPLYAAVAQTDSQWYLNKPIKDITFTGLVHVKLSDLDGVIKPYIGKEFTDTLFWDLQSKLYALDYFEQFTPTAIAGDPNKDSVIINFAVVERPIVGDIIITGNEHVSKNDILGVVVLKKGDIVTKEKVRSDTEAIKKLYFERGFPEVDVGSDVRDNSAEKTATVIFTVKEGAQTKVKKIEFTGNSFASAGTLRGLLKTKEQSLFNSGIFQESKLAEDKVAILKYYNDHGFEDAEVVGITRQQEIDKTTKQANLTLIYHIKEGPQYTYGGTTFQGNTLFSTKKLEGMIHVKVGDIVNKTRLDAEFARISDLYYNDGYIFNTFDRKETKDPQNHVVTYELSIVERGRAHIENIIIKGNTKTKGYVIRREIPLEVGDVFSKEKVLEGLHNLYNTQYFSSVTPETPPGSVDGLMDLVFNVAEAKTTNLSFGLSVSGSQAGFPLVGFLKLSDNNFLGRGLGLSVGSQVSSTEQNLTFAFNTPWLFGRRWSNGISLTLDHTLVTNEPQDLLPPIFTNQTNAVPDPYDGHYVFSTSETYGGQSYQAGDAFPGYPSSSQISQYNLETDYAYALSHGLAIPQSYLMTYDNYSITLGLTTGYSWFTSVGRFNITTGVNSSLNWVYYDPTVYRPFNSVIRYNLDHNPVPINQWILSGSWDTRDIVYSPTSGFYLKQAFTYTGGILPSARDYIRSDSRAEYYLTLLNIPVTDSYAFKVVADVRSFLSLIYPQFGQIAPIATSTDLLYIDGMTNALGWPRQINGEELWDNWLEFRIPILEQYLWWEFFGEGTAMWTMPVSVSQMVNLNSFLFGIGAGVRLVIPGLPIGLYVVKNFQVINGQLQWAPGSVQPLGISLVIAFNTNIY